MADRPDWLRDKVEKGVLGKKTDKGFYEWKDGKAQKEDIDERPDEEITDRLMLPMLNACVECFREGVIDDLDILDGAMIFATGFAPFRGGGRCIMQKGAVLMLLAGDLKIWPMRTGSVSGRMRDGKHSG